MFKYTKGWIGILLTIIVVYYGVVKGASNPKLFLNLHALILVIGGTIAVSTIAYPLEKLFELFEFVVMGYLLKRKTSNLEIAKEFILYARMFCSGPIQTKFRFRHPFMKECFSYLKKKNYSEDQYYDILNAKIESVNRKYFEDSKILISISKFPPALGLLGASTGMIEMMQNMGKGGVESIGSAMAVALVATFWGIAIANFIILPLSDHALREAEEDQYTREMILDSCLVLKRNQGLKVAIEVLLAKLSILDRSSMIEFINTEFKDDNNFYEMISQEFKEGSEITALKRTGNL